MESNAPETQQTASAIPANNYIDFQTFDALGFDVHFNEGQYNLHLVFMTLDKEENFENGMFLRTTIFEDTLELVGHHIDNLFEMGLFDNLIFMDTGHIIGNDGEILGEVDWVEIGIVRSNVYSSDSVH